MPTPIKKTNYFSYLTKYNSFEVKIWNTSNFTSIAHSNFTINISTRGRKGYMLPLQGGWVLYWSFTIIWYFMSYPTSMIVLCSIV